jgi:nicotinamidase-related amidase
MKTTNRKLKMRSFHVRTMLAWFLLVMFMISCSKDGDKKLSSSNTLNYLSVENYPEIYIEFDRVNMTVELLIPYKSLLSIQKVKLHLDYSEYATSNIDPEKEYDLTTPLIIKIIAEDNSIALYTLNSKKCEGGKSALLVCDIQKGSLPVFREDSFFLNSNIAIDKAFDAKVPIYYIMDASLKGSILWNLPEILHYNENGKIIDKNDNNSFTNTILHRELLLNGISKVYIIGLSSMGCILSTCKGSAPLKYDLTLISDAHDEPTSYWEFTEADIDKCNQIINDSGIGKLVKAKDLEFR